MSLFAPLFLRRVTATVAAGSLSVLALACGPGSGAPREREPDRTVPTPRPVRVQLQLIDQDARRLTVRLTNRSDERIVYSPSYYLLKRRTEGGTQLIDPFQTGSREAPSVYTMNALFLYPNEQSRSRFDIPSSLPRGRYFLLYPFEVRGTEPLARLPFELR